MTRHDPHAPKDHGAGGGYEKSDLAAKPVAIFAVVLTAVVAGVLIFILWMLDFFAARLPAPPPGKTASSSAVRSGPPEPPLQVDGMRNLRAMRAAEDGLLTSYGWVNREANTVHIPVERAMDLLVERGLPAAPESKAAPAAKPARRRR
jgi:hypothetical protein